MKGALLLGESKQTKGKLESPGMELCQSLPASLDESGDTVLIQGEAFCSYLAGRYIFGTLQLVYTSESCFSWVCMNLCTEELICSARLWDPGLKLQGVQMKESPAQFHFLIKANTSLFCSQSKARHTSADIPAKGIESADQ